MSAINIQFHTWWRQQMETFSALLAICVGNSPVPGEFPAQRPVTRSFDVLFDLRLNKRLSKQSWGWWFETLSCPLWRQCNDIAKTTGREQLAVSIQRCHLTHIGMGLSHLYNGNSYTGKTTYLCWNGPRIHLRHIHNTIYPANMYLLHVDGNICS